MLRRRADRERREKERDGEEASRGVVGPKVRRDQGRPAVKRDGTRRGEARPARVQTKGPGANRALRKRDSLRLRLAGRASPSRRALIGVDFFVGGNSPCCSLALEIGPY